MFKEFFEKRKKKRSRKRKWRLMNDTTPAEVLRVFNLILDDSVFSRETLEKTLLSIDDDSEEFGFIKKGVCEGAIKNSSCTVLGLLQKLQTIWERVDEDTRKSFGISILTMDMDSESRLYGKDKDVRELIGWACPMPDSFNAMDYAC